MFQTILRLTIASALIAINASANDVDPCDFASSGDNAFSWEQVMDCYRSVPFIRSDLEQIVGVLLENRAFSDLSELYDERYGWKKNLFALLGSDFKNDFEMHDALRAEHAAMQNPHISYIGPACYNELLTAFIPFDFSSAIWPRNNSDRAGGNQIIFIEGAPFSANLYRQHTGIDPEEYVGMRVMKIDNVPALKFFREYGREQVGFGRFDSSNLMNILNVRQLYSLRAGWLASSPQPDKPYVEMQLKRRNGELIKVKFPWLYGDRRPLGLGRRLQLPRSTGEFQSLCLQRAGDESSDQAAAPSEEIAPLGFGRRENREMMLEQMQAYRERKVARVRSGEAAFYEVPPDELDRDVEVIDRRGPYGRGLTYKDDTTVLRLFSTGPFYTPARATIAHACENSTRLIIDARSNDGGFDDPILWLYRQLFDDGGAPVEQSGKAAFRLRTDPEIWKRFLGFSSSFGLLSVDELGSSPEVCGFLPEPRCWQDLEAEGQGLIPYTEVDWFEEPTVTEIRGGVAIPLTRRIGLGESLHDRRFGTFPPRDVSSCQGKFSGKNLIILTDGANCSGGYLLLEPFIDNHKAVVVTMGGYVADPDDQIEVGTCRTGGSFDVDLAGQVVAEIEAITDGRLTMERPIPAKFARAVRSLMEFDAFYRGLSDDLHWDVPMTYDIRLNVWSDSPETDGYVYGKTIEAVEAYDWK